MNILSILLGLMVGLFLTIVIELVAIIIGCDIIKEK